MIDQVFIQQLHRPKHCLWRNWQASRFILPERFILPDYSVRLDNFTRGTVANIYSLIMHVHIAYYGFMIIVLAQIYSLCAVYTIGF